MVSAAVDPQDGVVVGFQGIGRDISDRQADMKQNSDRGRNSTKLRHRPDGELGMGRRHKPDQLSDALIHIYASSRKTCPPHLRKDILAGCIR